MPTPFRRPKPFRGQAGVPVSLPAPVMGLNTRDAFAEMGPRYAVAMTDAFPSLTHVEARKGYAEQTTQTGLNGSSAAAGFVKYGETSLWAAIYKQSTSELILKNVVSLATQTITGHTVIYPPIYTQFTNSAGSFAAVVFRNGASTNYYTYDGTTWTNRTATTTGSTAFKFIASFRNRLWFLSDATGADALTAHYLPTLAITGTPVAFPLGGMASRGGFLYAIGTWTRDGGEGGSDDLIAFITSAGQVIVYEGIDPSSDASFALVGVFDLPKPVGKPHKFGADLYIPTLDGLYSMAATLAGRLGPEHALSNVVRTRWQALAEAANLNGAANAIMERVSIAYSAKINHLLVKFRTGNSDGFVFSAEMVLNPVSGAWADYSNLHGYSHETLLDDIYFANMDLAETQVSVYKFGTAVTDANGVPIIPTTQQAYTSFGMPGASKQVTAIKPSFTVVGDEDMEVSCRVHCDFNGTGIQGGTFAITTAGSYTPVLSCPAVGTELSLYLTATMPTSGSVNAWKWYGTKFFFVPGGFL